MAPYVKSRVPSVTLAALLGWAVLFCVNADADTGAGSGISLTSSEVAAKGQQQVLANVSAFGRYSLVAESEQGVALQFVDRMAGPGEVVGQAGSVDGRLDLFLESGEYKVLSYGHEAGKGTAKLAAHSYQELHPKPPRLVELKDIHSELNDFQQRSYWLEVKQQRYVAIEAAGRSLGDLRLWKDGNWLVNVEPRYQQLDATPGQPLSSYQLVAKLPPGFYLVTAYGGRSQPWAEQSDDQPLHIRFGIPKLDEAGRRFAKVSPFGVDRWLVPHKANYFRLELPKATQAKLAVGRFDESEPFDDPYTSRLITKTSSPPVVEIDHRVGREGYSMVMVSADADQPYILQQFESQSQYSFSTLGNYWVSSIHSGTAQDSVDATSILTKRPYGKKEQFEASQAIVLGNNRQWHRRFNLLDTMTLYLEVPRAGQYTISGKGEGVRGKYRVEPFLTSRPRNYRSPPFEASGHSWNLDAGFYVLTVRPEKKGILELSIMPQGSYVDTQQASADSVAASTRYPAISVANRDRYNLYINQQPGVKSGVVLRRLPIDLSRSLPVSLSKNETLKIPVNVPKDGIVQLQSIYGELIPISVDGNQKSQIQQVKAGKYTVTLANPQQQTESYSLQFIADELNPNTPLPEFSVKLNTLPNYPVLSSGKPLFFDLNRNSEATYNVQVDKASLYRLESSGLLNTSGIVRTKTNPSLVKQHANGVGRNFLVQQYLREGSYQLTVSTEGKSAGHMGLSLQHAKLIEGGVLAIGVPARYTIPEAQGLSYGFEITEPGNYRLRALGLKQVRNIRLEDDDGWPLVKPGIRGDFTHHFQAGSYRVIIPPNAVETRALTMIERVADEAKYSGHGPHDLQIGTAVHHVWKEPALNFAEKREPDQWQFNLLAEADVNISLNNEMQGNLYAVEQQKIVAEVNSLKSWQGKLPAGMYRLDVTNGRKNNHVEYQLNIIADQLLPGQQRMVALPADVALSVGQGSLLELGSFGTVDVRARLYDADNTLLAKNDDRDHDWNFFIARKLNPGQYRLRLDAMGESSGQTKLFMNTPDEIAESPLALPAKQTISDDALHTFPLEIPLGEELLVITADSADTVGITVEVNRGEGWQWGGTSVSNAAHVLMPLSGLGDTQYRLRLWSIDKRGAEIALNVSAMTPKPAQEKSGKITMPVIRHGEQRIAIAALNLKRPGIMRVAADKTLTWSADHHSALQTLRGGRVAVTGTSLWLAQPLSANENSAKVAIERIQLSDAPQRETQFIIAGDNIATIDINAANRGPLLLVAESRSGVPGVQLGESADYLNKGVTQATSLSSTIAVSLEAVARAHVWNAGANDDNQSDFFEVSLSQTSFKSSAAVTLELGRNPISLAAKQAKTFTLPAGDKLLQLVLPANTAAIFSTGGQVLSTHWSGDDVLNEWVDSAASQLTLLHRSNEAAVAQLEVSKQVAPSALKLGDILQKRFASSGVTRIEVVKPETGAYRLHVRGDVQALLQQNDGAILQGNNIAISDSGSLVLRHQPGLVLAWLESVESVENATTIGKVVTLPSDFSLQGESERLEFSFDQATTLHVRSDVAVISRLNYPNGKQRIDAYPQGMKVDLLIPAGKTSLSLRPVANTMLSGHMSLTSSDVETIKEGKGPISILGAGNSRIYRFTVRQSGSLGIGVRASSGLVNAHLMDEAGRVISNGVVQMPELAAGDYYLVIEAPADSMPMTVQPVLIGLEPADSGPPQEVIRDYLEKAGIKMDEEGSAQ